MIAAIQNKTVLVKMVPMLPLKYRVITFSFFSFFFFFFFFFLIFFYELPIMILNHIKLSLYNIFYYFVGQRVKINDQWSCDLNVSFYYYYYFHLSYVGLKFKKV
jgi:hypothetical protein